MQRKNGRKKKSKRSRVGKGSGGNSTSRDNEKKEEENGCHEPGEKQKQNHELVAIRSLAEAFVWVTLEEATAAFVEANGDPEKAADILSCSIDTSEVPSTSSVSGAETSSTFGSGSSDTFEEGCYGVQSLLNEKGTKRGRQKKMVASAGTVSTMLGKDYVRSVSRTGMPNRNEVTGKEEAEQFLCSMLGNECELSLAVVRDVFGQCGYNVDKALDVLLDMSGSTCGKPVNDRFYEDTLWCKNDMELSRFGSKQKDKVWDGISDCTSFSSEREVLEDFQAPSYRSYMMALTGAKAPHHIDSGNKDTDLPQKVLESLFNLSRNSVHEPSKMSWRYVLKKMQALGSSYDSCHSAVAEVHQPNCVKRDEYKVLRKDANHHWDSRRCYYQRAAEAHSKGERMYAAYLADQGRTETRIAQREDKKASRVIFKARNKDIENVITIDLHGQHVKPAMKLLKVHLLFGSYVQSVKALRVITGSGSHGVGKSVLKQSVTALLDKEGIEWCEENEGTQLIKLDGCRDFRFVDSDSDSDAE